jgi:hypothetical protein
VVWFADTPSTTSSVASYALSTASQSVYTTGGVLSPSSTTQTLFSFARALALDPTGHLYIGDDPTDGFELGAGRAWRVTPGAL